METFKVTDQEVLDRMTREVARDHEVVAANVEKLKRQLADSESHLKKLEDALTCDHEFDPSQPNGMQLIESTCIKCGYTWYD